MEGLIEERGALDWRADPLWHALRAMRIGPAEAELSFERRLARENDWTEARAFEVNEEYRRFLYLAARVREPVTPSVAVDQAWHLHLGYSRHYWDCLCGEILDRPLHYDPTEGGPCEQERFRRQYERTLAAYEAVFGSGPPAAIWPDAETRFAARLCSVDRVETWLLPKAGIARAASVLFVTGALGLWAVLAEFGVTQLVFAVVYFGLVSLILASARRKSRKDESDFVFEWPDFGGGSGCGGGCGGCGG